LLLSTPKFSLFHLGIWMGCIVFTLFPPSFSIPPGLAYSDGYWRRGVRRQGGLDCFWFVLLYWLQMGGGGCSGLMNEWMYMFFFHFFIFLFEVVHHIQS
ncbi:hypothetical protein B9Z19DRAFT_1085399, partial [Tuber borchii]